MKIVYHPSFPGFAPHIHCRIEGAAYQAASDIDELARIARESDALLVLATDYVESLARALQQPGCRLKLIQFLSAGYETAEIFGVPEGTVVCNANDLWATAVAEHAVALALGLVRRFCDLERMRRDHSWNRDEICARLGSLNGARVAILGYGTVGQEIAKRLKPFGATVIGVARSPRTCGAADEILHVGDIDEHLPTFDLVINALPVSKETMGFMSMGRFRRMKPSAYFISIGRGATVCEAEMAQALERGIIAGAGIDVFQCEPLSVESPLWNLENVILSPHAAGYGSNAVLCAKAHALCQENLTALREGWPFRNQVRIRRHDH